LTLTHGHLYVGTFMWQSFYDDALCHMQDLLTGSYKYNYPELEATDIRKRKKQKPPVLTSRQQGNFFGCPELVGGGSRKKVKQRGRKLRKGCKGGKILHPEYLGLHPEDSELLRLPKERLVELIEERTGFLPPLWPEEQLKLMNMVDDLLPDRTPSDSDYERYIYYCRSIADEDVEDWSPAMSERIRNLLPQKIREKRAYE